MATGRYYVSVFGDVNSSWRGWLDWAQDVGTHVDLPLNYVGCSVEGKVV